MTIFTTLGDDGVIHALKETDVSYLVTSEELMPRLVDILPEVPAVQNLIYINPRELPSTQTVLNNLPSSVQSVSYADLINTGAGSTLEGMPCKHFIYLFIYLFSTLFARRRFQHKIFMYFV